MERGRLLRHLDGGATQLVARAVKSRGISRLLRCMSLLLAQSGHDNHSRQCPLLEDPPRDFSITYREP
jgi:hypothetical protein